LKVALVHYWLVGMRGGERVLEALCEIFPSADIFTLVLDPAAISPRIARHSTSAPTTWWCRARRGRPRG
jgi:hypothetical protein